MAKLIGLLTSLEGRISRKWFWIGSLITMAGAIILSFALSGILGAGRAMNPIAMLAGDGAQNQDVDTMIAASKLAGWINLLVFAVTFVPIVAVLLKRRHDRGSAGKEVWVYAILAATASLLQATGIGYQIADFNGIAYLSPNMISIIVTVATIGLSLHLLVVCGFLIGEKGDNVYGPDPIIGTRP